MKYFFILFVFYFSFSVGIPDLSEYVDEKDLEPKRIIKELVEYFQEPEPTGIPILEVPEPLLIDDTVSVQAINISNISISGHSDIRLDHFLLKLDEPSLTFGIRIPALEVTGNYIWPAGWFTSEGDLNATITEFEFRGKSNLVPGEDGILKVGKVEVEFLKDEFNLDMTGLSASHSVAVYAGSTFLDTLVIPFAQEAVQSETVETLNPLIREELEKYDELFPIDVSPFDFYVAKIMDLVTASFGLEPLYIPSMKLDVPSPLYVKLDDININGLKNVYRNGDVSVEYVDEKLYVRATIGIKEVTVNSGYSIYSSIIYISSGNLTFGIDDLSVHIDLRQPVDIRYPPTLRKIDIDIDRIYLITPGEGNVEYLMEFLVNILPNVFWDHGLKDEVEAIVKEKIQYEFSNLDLERELEDVVDKYFT